MVDSKQCSTLAYSSASTGCVILLPARVRGGELPRKHEAGTASGAVLSLSRRRLDTHATVPCRLHDDPSMFPLGLSGLRAPSRAVRATRVPAGHRGRTCVYLIFTRQSDGFTS